MAVADKYESELVLPVERYKKSRVKEDDNLIRIKNRDAAQELMEMTFG
ncbi:MAG: hypothetical protein J6N70_14620 [Oribacterium sp.]|nr:hypothetical protein [Oribacterium sp.]